MSIDNPALRQARPMPVWWEGRESEASSEPLHGQAVADLVIVGAGLTGLWAALQAAKDQPGRRIVLLDGQRVGSGASGRNGGFVSASLTHGLAHGAATWPRELPTLLRLGHQNLAEMVQSLDEEGVDADLRLCGKTALATRPHEVAALEASHRLHERHGEATRFMSQSEVRSEISSPTYLAGLDVEAGGLVDPIALVTGLRDAVLRHGVVLHEESSVTGLRREARSLVCQTPLGSVSTDQVLLASNAFPPVLRRIRSFVLPVWDHVLATEPLTSSQLDSVGWARNQGLTDSGNQFHYYRRTPDDRILWGGYDAVYYFNNATDAGREQRDKSHELLAKQFYATFPQLEGVGMSHRWAGMIDTTSRFTPIFGTAMGGRVAYAVGYTGLGVAMARFGAQVALDLLAGRGTERTELEMVRKLPVPFPPEPLRWAAVQTTRSALAREDRRGRRGLLLRTMDRLGVGFNS